MRKGNGYYWLTIVCFLLIYSCQKQFRKPAKAPAVSTKDSSVSGGAPADSVYDILLLMGQSNTLAGFGFDSSIDYPDPKVFQLGRFFALDHLILPATEPLQNITPPNGCIGFALTFAKLYAAQKLENGRQVLIIPCGASSTGFLNSRWNKGNDLYEDAVNRTNFVLQHYPGSKLKCFLWHQGESDVTFGPKGYQVSLENMIHGLYQDIKTNAVDSIPFIMGGFVPYWVMTNPQFAAIDSVLRNEPTRLPVGGFADPENPFVIKKPVDTVNAIHFDANGQRELGKRYFAEYTRLVK
jgi:Carbohydrate esterase, sialic acid-specific acetylesterase